MEYDVAFVGLGYVGLSTAVCFADRGINVLGVDIDSKKINRIKNADSPIHEKYMNELLEKAIKKNRLSLSRKVADVTKEDASVIHDKPDAAKEASEEQVAVDIPSQELVQDTSS